MTTRTVFIISDRTGITVEMLSHSLLTQFPGVDFEYRILPFVDDETKIENAKAQINEDEHSNGVKPLVFTTLVNDNLRYQLFDANGEFFDFFDRYIAPLERELGQTSSHRVGESHSMSDAKKYTSRIAAVNFSVHCDDGLHPGDYERADVILTGVSRSGKTPTSLYLALHFGLFTANYPITDEELEGSKLPKILQPHRDKLYGLTIDPVRLQQIRSERRANSIYSELSQCRYEVAQVEQIYQAERLPNLNATFMSIEEISATIIQDLELNREIF